MICDNCKVDRLVADFIKNQKYCYRCEYQKKIEKSPEYRKKKAIKCRMCKAEITQEKDAKKRPRSVFCSQECALKGHKELSKNYWTRQVKIKGYLHG